MKFPKLLSLALVSCSVLAADWAQFRGPNGQGHSSEATAPLTWSATENVAWQVEVPGQGWSSPIVFGKRVFVTTTLNRGEQCHVLAFDRDTGKVLWDQHVFDQQPRRKEEKNSFATPTPVTDGVTVYAVFGDGSFVAVNAADGAVKWTNRDFKFYSKHGLGASPILHGGRVIMPFDGSSDGAEPKLGWLIPWENAAIWALEAQTGRRAWEAKRGLSRVAHPTPMVMTVDGREQLISSAGNLVQGFDPRDGRLVWTCASRGEGLVPSPVMGDGWLFAPSGFEATTLRAIKPGGSGDVTAQAIQWEQKKGVPAEASPLFVAGRLFTVSGAGVVTCYDAKTGAVNWQERAGSNTSASPVTVAGRIYILDESGLCTVIPADGTFRKLAENSLEGRFQASPAVSAGRLFLRSDKRLWCVK